MIISYRFVLVGLTVLFSHSNCISMSQQLDKRKQALVLTALVIANAQMITADKNGPWLNIPDLFGYVPERNAQPPYVMSVLIGPNPDYDHDANSKAAERNDFSRTRRAVNLEQAAREHRVSCFGTADEFGPVDMRCESVEDCYWMQEMGARSCLVRGKNKRTNTYGLHDGYGLCANMTKRETDPSPFEYHVTPKAQKKVQWQKQDATRPTREKRPKQKR